MRIQFPRSNLDIGGSPTPILQYEAYRRINPPPSALSCPLPTDFRLAGFAPNDAMRPEKWEFVGAVPAHGESEYNMTAPTLADSTVDAGQYWSVFFIRAATVDPVVFFDSPPNSGYSIDNLAPPVPTGSVVAYEESNVLSWETNPDPDFVWFNVYRDTSPDFQPNPENLVHQTQSLDRRQRNLEPLLQAGRGGRRRQPKRTR